MTQAISGAPGSDEALSSAVVERLEAKDDINK